ncbi:MAG: archaellin/type IV pilin N-terminal domain-containing protein [Candidatus Nanohaloarchaea archaeon]|nr:archaellin/type IV pilin N-terminal domain-containing protein [Candidatus Nanohaloarchaea archaeon]
MAPRSPTQHRRTVSHARKAITPIVATVILIGLVLTMATAAMTFLQGQQARISEQLQQSLDKEVFIEETICNGRTVSFLVNNSGGERLSTGTAELAVYQGGSVNYSFTNESVVLQGPFQAPGSVGFLNVSAGGVFRSGRLYTIRLDFGQDFQINRACRAGLPWWDLNWNYRRQLVVTNTGSTDRANAVASVQFNTTGNISHGKLNPHCSDIRVVENGSVTEYTVDGCRDEDDLATIKFRTTVNQSDTEYDTYLYYGNLRADDASVDSLPTPDGMLETRLWIEEER